MVESVVRWRDHIPSKGFKIQKKLKTLFYQN